MFYRNLREDKEEILPLTELQKDMFAAVKLNKCDYLERVKVYFLECINTNLIRKSLEKLVQSQQALRTVFRMAGAKEPVQLLLKQIILPIYFDEDAPLPNMENEPWNVVIDERECSIELRYCHIVMDGWGMSIFWNELLEGYNALYKQNAWMPHRACSLHNYHENRLRNVLNDNKRNFLSKHFASVESKLADSLHMIKNSNNSSENKILLQKGIYEDILNLSAQLHITPATIFYATWAILISAFTRKDNICMGVISSGRNANIEMQNTIGMYIQKTPLCVDVKKSFPEICSQIRDFLDESSKYFNSGDAILKDWLKENDIQLIYDTLVVVENYPFDESKMQDEVLSIKGYDYFERPSNQFTLQVRKGKEVEILVSSSDNGLYCHLQNIAETYIYLLKQIGSGCMDINNLLLCHGNEDNSSTKQVQPYNTITEAILSTCEKNGEKTAIVEDDRKISYKELYTLAARGATKLAGLGIEKGSAVGMCIPRSIEQLVAIYSIILSGGVYVPFVNVPEERANDMIEQADVRLMIATDNDEVYSCNKINFSELTMAEEEGSVVTVEPNDSAYILFTSGSTGRPKGCEISHKAISNRLCWNARELKIDQNMRQLYKTPSTFDVSLVEIFLIFFAGHTLYILQEGQERIPEKIVDTIYNNSIDYLHFVPSMLKSFSEYIQEFNEQQKFKSVKLLVCSGEILPSDLVKKVYELNTNVQIVNLYGPTEAAVDVSYYYCPKKMSIAQTPIGKAIDNTTLLVLDDKKRSLPYGVEGELYILGDNLGKGYINQPELTANSFLTLSDGQCAYRTGDRGYFLEDGSIVVVGRIDEQVKYNGVRIEPAEIEQVFMKSGLLLEVSVIMKKQDASRLIVFYRAKESCESLLRQYANNYLPEVMWPSDYVLVDEFPVSKHGKINKKELIVLYNQKIDEEKFNTQLLMNRDELSSTEKKLSDIWNQLLGQKRVYGRDDNFFACGGNSITLVQMVVAIRKEWDVAIPSSTIYENPTLRVIAQKIENGKERNAESIHIDDWSNDAKKNIVLFQLNHPGSTAYNMPILIKLNKACSVEKAEQALRNVLNKYDWLHKNFFYNGEVLTEKINKAEVLEIKTSECSSDSLEEKCREFVTPFLIDERLFRAELLKCGEENYVLIDFHHLLCDQNVIRFLLLAWIDAIEGKKVPEMVLSDEEKNLGELKNNTNIENNSQEMVLDNLAPLYLEKQGMLERYYFNIDQQINDSLNNICKEFGYSKFQVLLVAYFILCGKISDKTNLIIGTNTTGDELISQDMKLRILPISIELKDNKNFKNLMQDVQQGLSRSMNLENDNNQQAFDVMFVREEPIFVNDHINKYIEQVQFINKETKYGLSLFYNEQGDKISCCFDYDASLFQRQAIEGFIESYNIILKFLLENTENSITNCPTIGENTKQIITKYCSGDVVERSSKYLQELFVENCMREPNTIIAYEGDKYITRYELYKVAAGIATELDKNVEQDAIIGILMPIGIKYLATVMGVLMAGCTFMPMDVTHPVKRHEQILKESKAVLYICDNLEVTPNVDIICREFESFEEKESFTVRSSHNAYCIFTSGSTGKPKGCVVNQKSAINYLEWANNFYLKDEKKCFALFTSPAVDMTITSILIPIIFGHKVVIFSQDADSIIRAVNDKRVTVIKATPSHLELLSKQDSRSELECLIVGGEQLKVSTIEKIKKLFKDSICIYNEYGPTESTVACMIYKYSENDQFAMVPIGSAIQNMTVTIRDKKGELSLIGTQGQLVIEGVGVIEGYMNDSKLTQNNFYYSNDGNWCYATGDKARMLSDGVIIYEGRGDEQYKLNGYRVELAEISEAAHGINGVEQAYAVIENKHLLLFCTLEKNGVITEMKLRKELFERVPRYMMPSQIRILDSMPLETSGKIDRKAILEIWKQGKSLVKIDAIRNYIRQCWEEELGRNDFSDEDGFLEVGGNSISIVSLQNRISKMFSNVSIADMFCYPSVATLSEYLAEEKKKIEVYDSKESDKEKDKVAIIGLGFELPFANDLESLRQVFKTSKSCARIISGQRMKDEKNRLRNLNRGSEEYRFSMVSSLESVDSFDNEYFRIGKDEADAMDPAHKLIISVIDDALANAGITKEQMKKRNCAVIIAMPTDIGFTDYVKKVYPSLAKIAPLNQVASSIVGRISFFYDIHGPAYLIDSACSSGLLGMNVANSLLTNGECDMAIVAGVNLVEAIDYVNVERAKVLSSHYHANTFSAYADGTSRGEGCICFVLEREENANKEEHAVYALVEGGAANNDGFATSLTAPNGRMQEQVIRQAWMNAGITAHDLDLIETHGTATPLGDAIELQALSNVMEGALIGHCAISAAKSVYGHLDTVSGLLGVLKCILSIRYKELYPLVGMTKPMGNEDMITSAFYFPSEVTEWTCPDSKKVICGVSSFGLSGTNVHLVLSGNLCSDVSVKRVSRLTPKRCWLPEEAEVQIVIEASEKKIEVVNSSIFSEKEILNILVNKVEQLFAKTKIDINVPLYKAGFDSISVIQLKLFVRNKFGLDIEVSSRDTMSSLVRKISKYSTKEVDTIGDVESEYILEKIENYNNSWYEFQMRYNLSDFCDEYVSKTKRSREKLLDEKLVWANGRFMTGFTQGLESFSYPILMENGKGAEVWDIDGNHYIDFAMGFGANLFGYKHPYITNKVEESLENGFVLGALMEEPFEFAERISKLTGLERVSFCNSGTEAIMNLIRIARAATGREKIVVFEGAFHGTFDPVYVQKNEWDSGHKPLPRSIGTPLHYLSDVTMLKYGEEDSLRYLEENGTDFAVVLVEPIQSRQPNLQPKEFLKKLREITTKTSTLLLFDEVITGFRNGIGGAQAFYGVEADLVSYGKVIGGGYPIGVFGGKAKYLDMIDHRGGLTEVGNVRSWVSTGGTFNGHPLSVAAGSAILDLLESEGQEIYSRINEMTSVIVDKLNEFFENNNMDILVESYGSQFIFTGGKYIELRLLQYLLIDNGIFVWEGGTCFVSAAHSWEQIYKFIDVVKECVIKMRELLPENDNIEVNIDSRVDAKDYLQIKKVISKNPNINEIRCLDDELVRVLAFNVANRATYSDYAMIHLNVETKVDENNVQTCLNKVINSHPHLCSGISWRRLTQPIQLIYKQVECPVEVHYVGAENKDKLIDDVVLMRKEIGFVLEKAPLVAFDIFIGEKDTDIVMSYYNSWFDGWSADLLLKEIGDALLYDKYPEQGLDWNEFFEWKGEHKEKVVQYWRDKNLADIKNVLNPNEKGQYYEVRRKFPEYLKEYIISYCEKNEISQAALYLSIMAGVMNEKYIMTSLSGRGAMVQGLMKEIGLFSGLLPVKAGSPIEMTHELETLNKLPICSYEKLAEITGVDVNELSAFSMTNATVILNKRNDSNNKARLIGDESYVHVPFRSYILPEEEILITGDTAVITQEKALNIADNFILRLEQIVEH